MPSYLNPPVTGGGGGGSSSSPAYTDPTVLSWTAVNQGPATININNGQIFLGTPALGGKNARLVVKTTPATPYMVETFFIPFMMAANNNKVGLVIRDSGSGRFNAFEFVYNNALCLALHQYNSFFGDNGVPYITNMLGSYTSSGMWVRLGDNGTTQSLDLSPDGTHWVNFFTTDRSFVNNPDQIGFFVDAENGSFGCQLALLSWKEVPG